MRARCTTHGVVDVLVVSHDGRAPTHECRSCGEQVALVDGLRRVNLSGHGILMEFHAERRRAHEKHSADSCEERLWDDPEVFRTWVEELMEAIQAHSGGDPLALRKELIQVGAMTEMWVQAIDDALPAVAQHPFDLFDDNRHEDPHG